MYLYIALVLTLFLIIICYLLDLVETILNYGGHSYFKLNVVKVKTKTLVKHVLDCQFGVGVSFLKFCTLFGTSKQLVPNSSNPIMELQQNDENPSSASTIAKEIEIEPLPSTKIVNEKKESKFQSRVVPTGLNPFFINVVTKKEEGGRGTVLICQDLIYHNDKKKVVRNTPENEATSNLKVLSQTLSAAVAAQGRSITPFDKHNADNNQDEKTEISTSQLKGKDPEAEIYGALFKQRVKQLIKLQLQQTKKRKLRPTQNTFATGAGDFLKKEAVKPDKLETTQNVERTIENPNPFQKIEEVVEETANLSENIENRNQLHIGEEIVENETANYSKKAENVTESVENSFDNLEIFDETPNTPQNIENEHTIQVEKPTSSKRKKKSKKIVRPIRLPLSDEAINKKQEKRQDYMLKLILGGMKLHKYLPILSKNHISYLDFLRLSVNDLVSMGINDKKDLESLCSCIQRFGNDPSYQQQLEQVRINGDGKEEAAGENNSTIIMKPLRIQDRNTLSFTEIIQMLDNIASHLTLLNGRRENDNLEQWSNVDVNGQVESKPIPIRRGVAILRQRLEKNPSKLLMKNYPVQALIDASLSTLEATDSLMNKLINFKEDLNPNKISKEVLLSPVELDENHNYLNINRKKEAQHLSNFSVVFDEHLYKELHEIIGRFCAGLFLSNIGKTRMYY